MSKRNSSQNVVLEYKGLSKRFYGINISQLRILGTVIARVSFDGRTRDNITLLVVPNNTMRPSVILGRDVLRVLEYTLQKKQDQLEACVEEILNIDISDEGRQDKVLDINPELPMPVQVEARELFEKEYLQPERPKVPAVDAELKLALKEHQPFSMVPRRLSCVERDILRKLLNDLLERGIIRASESEYSSPVVLVKKKNGEYRMCIDYRTLNKYFVCSHYPLPLIEDQLDVMADKKYFTLLDLKDGFHHIKVAEESVKYTSFGLTPLGQYEYLRMPFGLKTAPMRFQKFVNEVLCELIDSGDIVAYMDDFMVATSTIEHHLRVLRKVFRLLVNNLLDLRIDKAKFIYTEIEYLGYVISEKDISPTKEGIDAVCNFPVPRTVRQVREFIGLCSYFRKFIEKFSLIAKPLYDLLRKNVSFEFHEKELKVFEELKAKLVSAPILSVYSLQDDTELHCDASSHGFGAILMQKKKDLKFHSVFYFSKRATDAETKYHSFELETLAIIYALRRFRVYLHGLKFKIVTDCQSLILTLDKKDINPRISRWAMELQEFDYVVEHRNGSRMSHVDCLSRCNSVFVVEDNTFEFNLALNQNRDANIREL